MSLRSRTRIAEFKAQTQAKIDRLLGEYAAGRISREQFDAIYAHYASQLDLAEAALDENTTAPIDGIEGRTVAVRRSWMGRAQGVLIYHRRSARFIEALGSFDVPRESFIAPFRAAAATAPESDAILYRREPLAGGRWLLFTTGRHTLVVTLFQHEPAPAQVAEMQRLHGDFEKANAPLLAGAAVDSGRLAYPFRVFIQRKVKPGG